MNYLDYILLIIIGFSVIAGFGAGFTRVGIGFIATVLGILFGFWFYYIPAAWIRSATGWQTGANILGFFVIFCLFGIAGTIVGKILGKMLKFVGLSFLDRLGGAAFGAIRGAVLLVAIATVITAFSPHPPPAVIVDSKVMPYASAAGSVLAWLAPASVKDAYYDSLQKLRRLWDAKELKKQVDQLKGSTV